MTERPQVVDGKEIINAKPAGVISIGSGERKVIFLIEADHLDTLQAHPIKQEQLNVVLAQVGEKAHLGFPDIDPDKITFVQMGGAAITARENHRGVGKNGEVKFQIHGKNMITAEDHLDEIGEEEFSHLFLEPKDKDHMDFIELNPSNGHTDFLIINHDPADSQKATIYFIADPAEVVENGIATTDPKTDLLQFTRKVHNLLVGTVAPDFYHYPEQDVLEQETKKAFSSGVLRIGDNQPSNEFENLPRDAEIIALVYRIQSQFALRGSNRYKDKSYYKDVLSKIAPFYPPTKRKWYQKKKNHDLHVGVEKWEQLLHQRSQNNNKVVIQPEKPTIAQRTLWQNKWDKDLPLEDIGRLKSSEINDYLANRLLNILSKLKATQLSSIDAHEVISLTNDLSEYHALITTVLRSRNAIESDLKTPLDYTDTANLYKIGDLQATCLVPFLNDDIFNYDLSKKSRSQIVRHALERWNLVLRPIRKGISIDNISQPYHLTLLKAGNLSQQFKDPGRYLKNSFSDLFKRANITDQVHFHPYYASEMIMISKIMFCFIAEYQQMKFEDKPQYVFNAWASQLKAALNKIQEYRSDV